MRAYHKLAILLVFLSMSCLSQDRFDGVLSSTVRIKYERIDTDGAVVTGHGTAFGVDLSQYGLAGNRYLLTAAHNVLGGEKRLYGTTKAEVGGEWVSCSTVFRDSDFDLCVLEIGGKLDSVLKLDEADSSPEDELAMAGSKEGAPVKVFHGKLKKRFMLGQAQSYAEIEFGLGDSGSPIVSAKTLKVVGVAVAGFPDKDGNLDSKHGLYVPIVAIRAFLEELKP